MRTIKFQDFAAEYELHKEAYQQAVDRVLSSGWYILGKEVETFEKKFADYLGVKECIGVANGLEALQISLMALDIGVGDEVITTPLSAVATTLAILAVGATPVFVDTDRSGLINLDLVEQAITEKTKALLPVDLYGQSLDMDRVMEICQKHNIVLVEDACQAHGTSFNGQKIGSFGKVGCFSFYPTKNMGAFGDGGLIATNDEQLAEKCHQIRDYGQKEKYLHQVYGLNSRLDELQAAILQIKLDLLEEYNQKKRELSLRYKELLKDISQIEMIVPDNISDWNVHLFVIRTKSRDQLQQFLKEQGITSLVHYPLAIPQQPFLVESYGDVDTPEAIALTNEVLSLPCHPLMTEEDLLYVSDQIHQFYQ